MEYERIIEEWGPALGRLAASYAPPGAERDDLEQEIAASIAAALPAWRGEASARTYAFRIAHNCGIAAIRRRTDPRRPSLSDAPLDPPDPRPTPEGAADERERYERLAAAVRALPLALRQPMTLRLEGLSYAEIAEILGLTTSAVGVRIHRATARLKDTLREDT